MLKIYLMSVIIWSIILIATSHVTKTFCKAKDIDYSKYKKETTIKMNLIIVALIPLFRLFVFGTFIFLMGANEEKLDKLFDKERRK